MTAKDVAEGINAHLQRFERDPEINRYPADHPAGRQGLRPFFNAGAVASGRWVHVIYVSYQGSQPLTLPIARRYLAALDGGFIGRHHQLSPEAR